MAIDQLSLRDAEPPLGMVGHVHRPFAESEGDVNAAAERVGITLASADREHLRLCAIAAGKELAREYGLVQ